MPNLNGLTVSRKMVLKRHSAINGGFIAVTLQLLIGCVSQPPEESRFAPVAISELVADPARWDGQMVIVSGVGVHMFEHHGLYPDLRSACAGQRGPAVFARWTDAVLPPNTMREGRFRGTFRNDQGVVKPDGSVLVSNAAPGPGPLSDIEVVEWTSASMTSCAD